MHSQFLPQDKVCEFAELSSIDLLKQTEMTVGGEKLLNMHIKLIDLDQQRHLLKQDMETLFQHIETLKIKNQLLEKDVAVIKNREKYAEKVRKLFSTPKSFILNYFI